MRDGDQARVLQQAGRRACSSLPDPQMMVDVAPVERWDSDILTEEGLQRMVAAVNEIKEGCEALPVDGTLLQLHIWRYGWLRSVR